MPALGGWGWKKGVGGTCCALLNAPCTPLCSVSLEKENQEIEKVKQEMQERLEKRKAEQTKEVESQMADTEVPLRLSPHCLSRRGYSRSGGGDPMPGCCTCTRPSVTGMQDRTAAVVWSGGTRQDSSPVVGGLHTTWTVAELLTPSPALNSPASPSHWLMETNTVVPQGNVLLTLAVRSGLGRLEPLGWLDVAGPGQAFELRASAQEMKAKLMGDKKAELEGELQALKDQYSKQHEEEKAKQVPVRPHSVQTRP